MQQDVSNILYIVLQNNLVDKACFLVYPESEFQLIEEKPMSDADVRWERIRNILLLAVLVIIGLLIDRKSVV